MCCTDDGLVLDILNQAYRVKEEQSRPRALREIVALTVTVGKT